MNKTAPLFLLLGAATLAGLFLLLRPQPTPVPASLPASAATVATPPAAIASGASAQETAAPDAVATVEVEWVVQDGRRVTGPERIELRAGDTVILKIRSDRSDELHVHGYDLHAHLHAGEVATLRFVADRSGRFDCELHHSDLSLGALEVLPR